MKKLLLMIFAFAMLVGPVAQASTQTLSVMALDTYVVTDNLLIENMVTNEVVGVIASARTSDNLSEASVVVSKNNKNHFLSAKTMALKSSCGEVSDSYEHYIPIGLSVFEGAPVLSVLAEPLKAVPI